MSEGIETVQVVEPWLFMTLANDPALAGIVGDRIHNAQALGKQATPWLIYMLQSARDVTNNQGLVIQVDAVYMVKAVGQGSSYNVVQPAAARVHELLHRPGQTVTTDVGDLTCVRTEIVQYPELNDGVSYRHLGGLYRIRVNAH